MGGVAASDGIDTESDAVASDGARAAVSTRKYVVELIGTFFVVLTIGMAVASGSPPAPLAIGGVLMVMIFAGGRVSGAHYNPDMIVAALVRGRIDWTDAIGYWGRNSSRELSPDSCSEC
jgi:aquaporin Z